MHRGGIGGFGRGGGVSHHIGVGGVGRPGYGNWGWGWRHPGNYYYGPGTGFRYGGYANWPVSTVPAVYSYSYVPSAACVSAIPGGQGTCGSAAQMCVPQTAVEVDGVPAFAGTCAPRPTLPTYAAYNGPFGPW